MAVFINLLVKISFFFWIGIAANKWNIYYQQQKYFFHAEICSVQNIIFLAHSNPYVTEEFEIILVF